MAEAWPWLTLAGLGAFHGLNPAMGWLFAVALGLHRKSFATVLLSLIPIAVGHALAIAVVAFLMAGAGMLIDPRLVRIVCGVLLIGWALYHWRYGHRHRVRVGMQAGFAGLALWSFLMASAHGAGLMLWPALGPLCFPEGGVGGTSLRPFMAALAGVSVHTLAMLTMTGLMATLVYAWLGLGVLRQAWFNIDALWIAALLVTGTILLVL
ncbi:hypothetical protein [Taklimakanibacter albus]|uniref:Uncharacterized protein n=1 Tax=Taklimakanibacter albus TaxID=2800327 RepID=A0ACC5R9L8_9HYPH|nr:hypothetical protein [Aestuariivirga sp. YIM B02566]MBK1869338.1 hypothetical protein [Aestuariivirga sp. YIM B02566]